MTPSHESELAGRDLIRRLTQLRRELTAAGEAPSRLHLERLIARVSELGLSEHDVGEELAELRARVDAAELKMRLSRNELPRVEAPEHLPPGDVCHFVCAVRFGRRRADQFGHLLLSAGWLQFRGALDVSVAWLQIGAVRRDGRDLLVALEDSTRALRFSCHSHAEAARAAVIAAHLTNEAHSAIQPRARTTWPCQGTARAG